jgi:hypothetical protein
MPPFREAVRPWLFRYAAGICPEENLPNEFERRGYWLADDRTLPADDAAPGSPRQRTNP